MSSHIPDVATVVRVVVEGPWNTSRDIIGHVVKDVRVKDRTVVVVLASEADRGS